jgi:hypothetical protein
MTNGKVGRVTKIQSSPMKGILKGSTGWMDQVFTVSVRDD